MRLVGGSLSGVVGVIDRWLATHCHICGRELDDPRRGCGDCVAQEDAGGNS